MAEETVVFLKSVWLLDGEDEEPTARQRCFERKFAQRERRRLNAKAETARVEEAIADHNLKLQNMCYGLGREGEGEVCRICDSRIYGLLYCNGLHEFVHWGCASQICGTVAGTSNCSVSKKRAGLRGKESWQDRQRRSCGLLRAMTVCCFVGLYDATDHLYDRSKQKYDNSNGCNDMENDFGGDRKLEKPAAWLAWEKTRDEIFGVGMEAWGESWAVPLIFGQHSEIMQVYLWESLAKGRHYQHGMGTLSIPAEWKKKCARSKEASRKAGQIFRRSRSSSHRVVARLHVAAEVTQISQTRR